MVAALVDTEALWKILLAALAGGVGLTAVFGFGILRYEDLRAAREQGDTGAIVAAVAVLAVCAAVCVGALVVGFLAMTKK